MPDIRLLHIGDVVGDGGVQAAEQVVPRLREERALDVVVCNVENCHQGRGVNERMVRRLFKAGVDVCTGGDHSFDKHLIIPYIANEPKLLRPHNYPDAVAGSGLYILPLPELGLEMIVVNLRGLAFFNNPIPSPFEVFDALWKQYDSVTPLWFVDFHAEATAEKVAFGWHVDGRASAVSGTHTHVQTGDERILPEGTGYLTDVGFTGAHDGVIGIDLKVAQERQRLQIPRKTKLARGNMRLDGAIYTLQSETGRCSSIKRLSESIEDALIDYKEEDGY